LECQLRSKMKLPQGGGPALHRAPQFMLESRTVSLDSRPARSRAAARACPFVETRTFRY
jgi:hypothetical protein